MVEVATRTWPLVLEPAPDTLIQRIARAYPIGEARTAPYRGRAMGYCVWGAVNRWFGWGDKEAKAFPFSFQTREASGGRLATDDICAAMQAHDQGVPTSRVWNLAETALRNAGLT